MEIWYSYMREKKDFFLLAMKLAFFASNMHKSADINV